MIARVSGWRRRLRESGPLSGCARVAGAFAPPVAWVYIGATLPDREWGSLAGRERALLSAAAVLVPAGTVVALVLAVLQFAIPQWRGDLLPAFIGSAAVTFVLSLGVRSILMRVGGPDAGET